MVGRAALTLLVAVAGAAPASAAATRAAAGAGAMCAGPQTVSALNQYCENVPTAGGGQSPGPGTPALSSALPPRVAGAITRRHGPSVTRKLLALPAASLTPLHLAGQPPGRADPLSLLLPLVLVLVALAAAIAGAAHARRRRQRRLRTA